jgi:hypothetical protein
MTPAQFKVAIAGLQSRGKNGPKTIPELVQRNQDHFDPGCRCKLCVDRQLALKSDLHDLLALHFEAAMFAGESIEQLWARLVGEHREDEVTNVLGVSA